MTKDQQIPVLHIYHNQDAEIYRATIREDKAYMKGEKCAEFSSKGIFTVKDNLHKKKFKMIIYLDGKANTCQQQNGKEMKKKIVAENKEVAAMENIDKDTINQEKLQEIPDNLETIFEPLTFKDRITVVKREIAKQLGKFKPMETWQFGVLIAIGIASIVIGFIT